MKENLNVVRTKINTEPVKQDEPKKPDAPAKKDYTSREGKTELLRKAILDATKKFASQPAFGKESKLPLNEREKKIAKALQAFSDNPTFFAQLKALTEAIINKELPVEPVGNIVRYNQLCAFVPLGAENGHTYPLNSVSVSFGPQSNGSSSVSMTTRSGGNTPPDNVVIRGERQIRPATEEEINNLNEQQLQCVEANSRVVLIPVEV
jgi:hypothetical protein